MYKAIETTTLTGNTNSPETDVPGRLMGVALDTNGLTATVQMFISAGAGWATIFVNGAPLSVTGAGVFMLPATFQAVTGMTRYRVLYSAATTANAAVVWYYDDMPTLL